MPFIQPTENPATALGGLAGALFGDPSRMARGSLYGAEAERNRAQTQELQRQGIARNAMQQAAQAAAQAPTPENLAAVISTAQAAGYSLPDTLRGIMAANAMAQAHTGGQAGIATPFTGGGAGAGSPAGGPTATPNALADTMLGRLGQPFGQTQTGFGQELANQTQRAQIAIQPGMAQVGLNRQIANSGNAYQDPNSGQVSYLPIGAQPPAGSGALPAAQATSQINARTGILPGVMNAELANRTYNAGTTYIHPATGQTAQVPPGTAPPTGMVPMAQAAPMLQAQSQGMRPTIQPDPNSPTGQGVGWSAAGQTPPPGAIPFDPHAPVSGAAGVALYGRGPGSAGQTQNGVRVDLGTGTGPSALSGTIAPAAGAPPAPQPTTASAPGAPAQAPQAQAPQAPQTVDPIFAQIGFGTGSNPDEKASEGIALDKAIDEKVKQYNEVENRGSVNSPFTADFQVSPAARTAIIKRASELKASRASRATFNRAGASLDAAWAEIMPTLQRDGGLRHSILRLPNERGGPATGPGTGAPAPTAAPSAPAPAPTPAAPETTPAPPPSAALSSTFTPVVSRGAVPSMLTRAGANVGGPGGGYVRQAQGAGGPAPAQPSIPPVPPVEQRQVGQTYTLNGRVARWLGNGWQPVQ